MKTIFLFIDNPLFISDLLRTKYIEYLTGKYKALVFTPAIDSREADKNDYFKSPNLEYVKWSTQNKKLLKFFLFLRSFCIREFDYLSTTKGIVLRKAIFRNKRGRILRFLSSPFNKFLTADFFTSLETFLIPESKLFTDYCRKYKPSLIIAASPGLTFLEAEAIILAKKRGIPTLAANFTWDNLTTKARLIHKTDYLFIWNNKIKEEAINIHRFDRNKIFVTGINRFDIYFRDNSGISREEFLRSKHLDPRYKTILFATTTTASLLCRKYLDQLIEFRRLGIIPYVNIFIRLHPGDEGDYSKYLNKNIHLEWAGEMIDWGDGRRKVVMNHRDFLNTANTLRYADLNINFCSTLSLESAIFDVPIINFVESGYEFWYQSNHYQPIIESGAVRLTYDLEQYKKAIIELLNNPALDKGNRQKLVNEYISFRDGLSYKRNVDLLEKII